MMIMQIILYFFFPVTLLATVFLSKKSHLRSIFKFIPAAVSVILAVFFYSLFLYNNGIGEFMSALFLCGITLANLFLILVFKLFNNAAPSN
ncbi:hypothetical protein [Bacillus arachidis]|uniref:hypothetical protein n=1 Tax=Bacillus arachidis TaxID=2819290 RepID=UPI00255CD01F|nr:hypothetical protein [Bacillus arachidis]WIY58989.1 hypothetical protein QRY57_01515 [Bacillus arachidis]